MHLHVHTHIPWILLALRVNLFVFLVCNECAKMGEQIQETDAFRGWEGLSTL